MRESEGVREEQLRRALEEQGGAGEDREANKLGSEGVREQRSS